MAEESLDVYLNDLRAGALYRRRGGKLEFEYNQDYAGKTPLSYSMPLAERLHRDAVVTPFLWNLLPDDLRLLQTWGRRYGVDPGNCFALLREIGEDCAGAVRLIDPERQAAASAGGLERISEKEIGERLEEMQRDPSAARSLRDHGRFSLAGAQPKVALRKEGGQWHVPWGKEPTSHILKPPRPDFAGLAENEHFCLNLASSLGIRAAESAVEEFAGRKAIVVKRYDRFRRSGQLVRIHQEDACQALGVGPQRKYESDGGPGVSDLMKLLAGSKRRIEDRDTFMDAILFNYLILGTDAHAKNYAILHAQGEFIMAPLYDVASFAPYARTRKEERLAMRIDRYYKIAQIQARHFERMARACDYPPKRLMSRLEELATLVPVKANELAAQSAKAGIDAAFLESLAQAFTARSQTALDHIVSRTGRDPA